ncbi:hypothetical protein GCM10023094_20370 [Rhodococcus olei]|uniref:AMIN-like domain-containing protein n=1 Tax=Rhodococcus olei TaxID=2161675 RepID=A0ABP8P113_9NOCA
MIGRQSRSRGLIKPSASATALVALGVVVAGCGADPPPDPTATAAAASAMSEPGPAGITNGHAELTAPASLSVTDVRVGSHAGFDRVVYELGGVGTPGWTVRYVDQAVQDASGKVLDVPGRSIIEVSLTGTGYPFDTGVPPYAGPNPLPGAGVVSAVRMPTVFEGVTQSFVGLSTGPRPVTVSLLTDPVRLVLDVAG